MSDKKEEEVVVPEGEEQKEGQEENVNVVLVTILTPLGENISLGPVSLLENGSFLRQNLSEIYQTCCYTHYNIEHGAGADAVVINDYVELMNYIPPSEDIESKDLQSVTLRMTLVDYGEKAAMSHVKRFRDIVMFPPQSKGLVAQKDVEEVPETSIENSGAAVNVSDEELTAKKEQAKKILPNENAILDENISLKGFYDNTLYSLARESAETKEICLGDSILNVSYSGWNPPPYSRTAAGDLCYFEVRTASNSVIHITAISGGFYVNNCTLNHFDPSPAEKANFSHELLFTLVGANPSFKAQWESLALKLDSASKELKFADSPATALKSIATLYEQGRGDYAFQNPQWHAQVALSSGKGQKQSIDNKHKYDSSRAQVVLADAFGMEEKGVPREWNDEIQSIRALPAKDTSEQIMKSRFIHRTTTEFTEACRQTVIAICKGHIAPVNPMDSEESQVYIYNNIFFSRSIDSKEAFKVCSGDEACRKSAAQDFNNQKLLHSLDIEGLSSVLCTIVDYKGQRYVGQSIVPGILQHTNASAARLMYGALEEGVRLKCKGDALAMMQKIGEKLHIAERNILATPSLHLNEEIVKTPEAVPDSMLGFLSGPEAQQSPSIKIDDDDETCSTDAKVISHIGPVEGKLLKGSDDRLYVLEVNRLTPLDANFIEESKGGTGNVKSLSSVDADIKMTYCLRQELLQEFMSAETMSLRQNELQTLLSKLKVEDSENEEKENTLEDKKEVDSKKDDSNPDSEEQSQENNIETTVTETTPEENRDLSAKVSQEELERITKLEPSFLFNANCFLGDAVLSKDSADDAEALKNDEKVARDVANFLWAKSLPNLHTMIRIGSYAVQDGKGLTDLMHARGINMRYLGQLATLADAAEVGDKKVNEEGKVMKNPMPLYWLELLVIEVIARSMKHVVNSVLRSNKAICAAPAQAVSLLLNYLLGGSVYADFEMETTNGTTVGKKKNKKASSKTSSPTTSSVPDAYKAPFNKEQFWSKLLSVAKSKFLFDGSLVDKNELSSRISRVAILRRVCQQCGVRVACKEYDFSVTEPILSSDIQELYPLVKSSEPLVTFAAGTNLLQAAMTQLQSGNHGLAYELAQESSKWMGQVTGPVHASTCQAIEIMASVLVQCGDNEAAIATMTKKLTLDVQLFGLDSDDVMKGHTFLGTLYHELNNFEAAVAHMQAALYILRLLTGNTHPEIANMYFRLAVIYQDIGNHSASLSLLNAAQKIISTSGDLAKVAPIYQTISTVHTSMNNFKDAISAQKHCWNLNRQLHGEEDQRTEQSKTRLATLIRENADYNAKLLQDKADRERSEKANHNPSLWLDDDFKKSKKKSSSKKKSGSKKKPKAITSDDQEW